MRRRTSSHIAPIALLALLTSALAGAEATGPASRFGPGEQSTYAVSYLGVRAGIARITVGSETQQWGKTVWPIVTVARSDDRLTFFPVRDKFVSYWETQTQETLGNDLFADENNKRRRQRVVLDPTRGRAKVLRQKEGEGVSQNEVEVTRGSRDITAVIFALRERPLAVGDEYRFPIYTGAKSFEMVANVEASETLDTALGKREVVRLRVKTEFSGRLQSTRDMRAYFTADDMHLPVRIEADFVLGTLVAELTDYQPGRQLAALTPGR